MLHRNFVAVGALMATLAGVPAPVMAQQQCGNQCAPCAVETGWAGYTAMSGGFYDRTCFEEVPYCIACAPDLVAGNAIAVPELMESVRSASPTTLARLVGTYRERMLVSQSRGLLVFKGASCDPEALAVTLVVGADLAHELAMLGVPSIESHLAAIQDAD